MDFIIGLPLSNGFITLMVVLDRLTKYAHLGALSSNFNATRLPKLFVDIVVRHHGFPSEIISDRDRSHIFNLFKPLIYQNNTYSHA